MHDRSKKAISILLSAAMVGRSSYRKLSNLLIIHADIFIKDIEEVENETLSFITVKVANQTWIREVKDLFFKLSNTEVPPVIYNELAETILEMGEWIVDLALLLEHTNKWETESDKWLLKNSLDRNHSSVDKPYKLSIN